MVNKINTYKSHGVLKTCHEGMQRACKLTSMPFWQ